MVTNVHVDDGLVGLAGWVMFEKRLNEIATTEKTLPKMHMTKENDDQIWIMVNVQPTLD